LPYLTSLNTNHSLITCTVQEHAEYLGNDNSPASKLTTYEITTPLSNGELPLPYKRNTYIFYKNKYAQEIKVIFLIGLPIHNIISLRVSFHRFMQRRPRIPPKPSVANSFNNNGKLERQLSKL